MLRGAVATTYSDEDPLVLEINISDGELVGERHFDGN
jgi:hypothetical protein